jgi:hypothetical protein
MSMTQSQGGGDATDHVLGGKFLSWQRRAAPPAGCSECLRWMMKSPETFELLAKFDCPASAAGVPAVVRGALSRTGRFEH